MDDIEQMSDLVTQIRELLDSFDFDVHNDEANPYWIDNANTAAANLETAIESLVP